MEFDFKTQLHPDHPEKAVSHRVPPLIRERLRDIMEKKKYKRIIADLGESEAIYCLREAYDESMREHAVN